MCTRGYDLIYAFLFSAVGEGGGRACAAHASGPLPQLGLFGIIRVYNPNSWITIPMTRIVGKIYKNTIEIKENNHRGAPRPCGARPSAAPLFSLFSVIFLYILPTILVIGIVIQEFGL